MSLKDSVHRAIGRQITGTPIWSFDWDICCLLDGCRVDTFREFYPNAESYWSVESSSKQWLRETFEERDNSNVALITANPFATVLDNSEFAYVHQEPVSKTEYGIETVEPERLGELSVSLWNQKEKYGVDQLVIHFMQPHVPFRSQPEWFTHLNQSRTWGSYLWSDHAEFGINEGEWFDAYRDNLRWVLQDGVYPLLDSVDATVGITADHGNAHGEFGVYGHPHSVAVPAVRKVPWATLDCTRRREPELAELPNGELSERERSKQLEALGYR